jgi:hypothetical protein
MLITFLLARCPLHTIARPIADTHSQKVSIEIFFSLKQSLYKGFGFRGRRNSRGTSGRMTKAGGVMVKTTVTVVRAGDKAEKGKRESLAWPEASGCKQIWRLMGTLSVRISLKMHFCDFLLLLHLFVARSFDRYRILVGIPHETSAGYSSSRCKHTLHIFS